MSCDNVRAYWSEEEQAALVSFLLKQKCTGKMGDGTFKSSILNAAAAHLAHLFPNQKGPMKNSEHCKRQIASLKVILRDINQWRSTSCVHWDNVNGAKVVMEEEKQVFKIWLQFENSRWHHLEVMEELFPNDQVHGSHAFHPTSQTGTAGHSISGISTGPHPSPVPGTSLVPPGYVGSNSSHISSNLIMTLSISPIPLQFVPPLVRSPTGTIADGVTNNVTVKKEKSPDFISNFSSFQSPHSVMLPLAAAAMSTNPAVSPATGSISSSRKCALTSAVTRSGSPLGERVPTAEAALQSISLTGDGEHSLKRAKQSKHQSTQAALVGMQGSMSFLSSVVMSLSPIAVQQMCTDKLQAALMMVEECDQDLPIEARTALMESPS
ncbi:hypothetical protein EDC04DRAFT_2911738 [Pisolithus marmoratus]|nr:hypothetical protein EDC04DRAFT_2911738 [Pisolithus marmoratus]